MKLRVASLLVVCVAASLVATACAQPVAAPAPTAGPTMAAKAAEPTKAIEPTKSAAAPTQAAVAQPAAAPAKKVDFPAAGKPITLLVPWPAGGVLDICARILAPPMEKDLGVPVVVVNKPGASGQMGATELAKAKPDGYTIGYMTFPTTVTPYLDPQRKAQATYSRKDFKAVSLDVVDPEAIMVPPDSPIKSLKDLIDAAKAKPNQVKISTTGLLTNNHLALLLLQKAAGVSLNLVHFEGGPPAATAVMGGHVDAGEITIGASASYVRGKQLRYLGVYDKQRNKFFPDTPTLQEQGYNVTYLVSRGFAVPAGTPDEIVQVLAQAFKKAMDDPAVKAKVAEVPLEQRYLDPPQFSAWWDDIERQTEPLLVELAKEGK